MIETNMPLALGLDDVVRLRPDLCVETADGELQILSRGVGLTFHDQPGTDDLARMLTSGLVTAKDIALHRERSAGVPLADSLALLDRLFTEGMLEKEPAQPEVTTATTWTGNATEAIR